MGSGHQAPDPGAWWGAQRPPGISGSVITGLSWSEWVLKLRLSEHLSADGWSTKVLCLYVFSVFCRFISYCVENALVLCGPIFPRKGHKLPGGSLPWIIRVHLVHNSTHCNVPCLDAGALTPRLPLWLWEFLGALISIQLQSFCWIRIHSGTLKLASLLCNYEDFFIVLRQWLTFTSTYLKVQHNILLFCILLTNTNSMKMHFHCKRSTTVYLYKINQDSPPHSLLTLWRVPDSLFSQISYTRKDTHSELSVCMNSSVFCTQFICFAKGFLPNSFAYPEITTALAGGDSTWLEIHVKWHWPLNWRTLLWCTRFSYARG